MDRKAAPHNVQPNNRGEGSAHVRLKLIRWLLILLCLILAAAMLFTVIRLAMADRDGESADTDVQTQMAASGGIGGNIPEPEGIMRYAKRTENTREIGDGVDSDFAILIDLENGEVIADKDGDERIYPASMTKLMTLIVACERAKSLDDTFVMTADITDPLYRANASVAGFSPGESVTVRDLIYALILPSGADGAMGLAFHIAGDEEKFAVLMNEKVKEMGLKNTHFTNSTGLHDDNQYSTCHDIALILEYALRDEFMKTVLSTYQYQTEKTPYHPDGITLYSTMQSRLYGNEAGGMFIVGGKTGYTLEAKNCLASFAVRFDESSEKEEDVYKKDAQFILVTAYGNGKWVPIFDAINTYATVADPNALETRQYSNQ